jgi:DNA mismatch endonuclease (patch repair protein)
MTDVHEPVVRSYNMSQIKGKNTKPEIIVRRFLHAKGFRFRLHNNLLPGKPDIVLKKYRTVVFVNGCFWHGHDDCKYFILPKTRRLWWENKLDKNKERDLESKRKLSFLGWKVIVIWECELKKDKISITLENLISNLL